MLDHMSSLGNVFEKWGGSLGYLLSFPGNEFTAFRMRVVHFPPGVTPPSSLTTGDGDLISTLFDVKGSTSFQFLVPPLNPRLLTATGFNFSSQYDLTGDYVYPQQMTYGIIALYLEGQVVNNNDLLDYVPYTIWRFAGPDFTFSRLRQPLFPTYAKTLSAKGKHKAADDGFEVVTKKNYVHQSGIGGVPPFGNSVDRVQSTPMQTLAPVDVVAHVDVVTTEDVYNIRTLLHRFVKQYIATMPTASTPVVSLGQFTVAPNSLNPALKFVLNNFRYWRGSINYRITAAYTTTAPAVPTDIYLTVANVPPSNHANLAAMTTAYGGIPWADIEGATFEVGPHPTVTVKVPFTSGAAFRYINSSDAGVGGVPLDDDTLYIAAKGPGYSALPPDLLIYSSVGDDFSLGGRTFPGYVTRTYTPTIIY
jgi:hypothetical protein